MNEFVTVLGSHSLALVEMLGLPVLFLLFVLKGALIGKVVPTSVVLPGYVLAIGATYWQGVVVIVLVTVAHIIGQLFIYVGARRYGESFLASIPYVSTESGTLKRLDEWFQRHGGATVFVTNVVPWSRGLVAIPAGLSSYPLGRYTFHTTTSTLIYHGVYVLAPLVGLAMLV